MNCRNLFSNKSLLFLLWFLLAFLLIVPSICLSQDTKTDPSSIIEFLIDALTTAKGGSEDSESKAQAVLFTGKMVNYGSGTFQKSEDFIGVTNFRPMDGGMGTRLGMAGWSTNAELNKRSVIKVIPFETDTESHIIAAGADAAGSTYYKVEGKSFTAGNSLWYTSGATTDTKITHAKVRDTVFIADAGGITAYGGVSVFPTALLIESTKDVYTDNYDWIYSGTSHSVGIGETVYVGYSRPFDRLQTDKNSSGMDTIPSGVTETLVSGKMRYWATYAVTKSATGYITNGDFDSGTTTGWTDETGAQEAKSGTTTEKFNGAAAATVTGFVANWCYTYQTVNVTAGEHYQFVGYGKANNAQYWRILLQAYPNSTFYGSSSGRSETTWTGVTTDFKATTNQLRIRLETYHATTTGKTSSFDALSLRSGSSTFNLPKIECRPRELGTSWDGMSWMYPRAAGVHITGVSEFQDYSKMVDNSSEEQYMDISQLQSGGTIFLGFTMRPRLVHVFLPEGFKNNVAATLTGKYWDGTDYITLSSFSDGTASSSVCLKQSGVLDFTKVTNWKKRKVGTVPYDLYVLALKVSTTISNYVRIYEVKAIPDYDSPSSVGKFRGVASAHDRLFLFNGRDKTKLIVSAENQPDCFIGSDANDEIDKPLTIGKQENFIHVGPLGENVLVMKETENFILGGVNRNTWAKKQLRGTAPCIASDSVAVVELEGESFVIYLARNGWYAINASGANPYISEDIRAYFEEGNALEFPASTLKHAFGWFDPTFQEYHCVISGKELVYSIKHKKWYINDRGYALQTGTYFVDKNKVRYHLGGGSGGTIFALESGTSDYGATIISEYCKPNMILGGRAHTKNELRSFGLRYELPDGQTISGNTFYITPKATTTATEHLATFSLSGTSDYHYVNLNTPREAGGLKGWTHKIRAAFRGRVNLLAEIIESKPAPWEK